MSLEEGDYYVDSEFRAFGEKLEIITISQGGLVQVLKEQKSVDKSKDSYVRNALYEGIPIEIREEDFDKLQRKNI